jgi:hypothetical protein
MFAHCTTPQRFVFRVVITAIRGPNRLKENNRNDQKFLEKNTVDRQLLAHKFQQSGNFLYCTRIQDLAEEFEIASRRQFVNFIIINHSIKEVWKFKLIVTWFYIINYSSKMISRCQHDSFNSFENDKYFTPDDVCHFYVELQLPLQIARFSSILNLKIGQKQ